MNLWLDVYTETPEDSNAWQTTVGVDTQVFRDQHVEGELFPETMASALYYRMTHRDDTAQMPPLATKNVDQEGIAILEAWIESLP